MIFLFLDPILVLNAFVSQIDMRRITNVKVFYGKNYAYLACHYSCGTCTGGAINECLDCPIKVNREFDPNNKQCNCPSGY